jgi:hypothetical protein
MFAMKWPVSLQSRDIQQLLGKLSKLVCNWRGKVFRAAARVQNAFRCGVAILQHGLP